jgi:hypothetical protein
MRRVAAACVGILVVLAAIGGLIAALAWADGIPFWGHPDNEEALVGTWEGSYSIGNMRLVLNEDHTFIQHLYGFPDVEPAQTPGTWEYSDGTLRLLPGLRYTHGYTEAPGVAEFVLSPTMELDVHNTIWPWAQRIWDEDMSLGKR